MTLVTCIRQYIFGSGNALWKLQINSFKKSKVPPIEEKKDNKRINKYNKPDFPTDFPPTTASLRLSSQVHLIQVSWRIWQFFF